MQSPLWHGISWLILYLQEGLWMLFNFQNIFLTWLAMIICFVLHLMEVKLVLQHELNLPVWDLEQTTEQQCCIGRLKCFSYVSNVVKLKLQWIKLPDYGRSFRIFLAVSWVALIAVFELWVELFVHLKAKSNKLYSAEKIIQNVSVRDHIKPLLQRCNTKRKKTQTPAAGALCIACANKLFSKTFFKSSLEVWNLVTGSRAAKGQSSLFCNWALGKLLHLGAGLKL